MRKSGLRSAFHFTVDISMIPVRSGSKWKRRAYCVSAKLLPNQAFSSVSYRSPFLFKAVIQSSDKSVWEITPKLFGSTQTSCLSLVLTARGAAVCVCVCVEGGYHRTGYSVLLREATFTPAVKVF